MPDEVTEMYPEEPKPSDLVFHTSDAPEAGGRQPGNGTTAYTLSFPLDDGRTLWITMGKIGIDAVTALIAKVRNA